MKDIPLKDVYFFVIERAIKSVRRYSQNVFNDHSFDLTVDQWIVLKRIHESEGITQAEIAEDVIKDNASVTRIIDQLVKKELVSRQPHAGDRRRFSLTLTKHGVQLYKKILPVIIRMRAQGIEGISEKELKTTINVLNKIAENAVHLH